MVLYVDLSHHDWDRTKGELGWAAIRTATSPVVCLRATYGDPAGYHPTTRHFADMARGAKAAGFDTIGGYHNLIKGDQASINRQVDYLRRELDQAGATWAMLDVERYPELLSNGLWPRFDDVQQFVARWRAVDRRVLAIYLPRWNWNGHLGRPDLRPLRCPLVASDYGSNPGGSPSAVYAARGGDSGPGWTAYGGVTPSMWQYGSNINCPGASRQTDVNAYRGTLAQLRALLTGQESDMDATQAKQLAEVFEIITRWRAGMPTMADGKRVIAPVDWRIRDEAWQAKVTAALTQILGHAVDEDAIVRGVLAGLGTRPEAEVAQALVAAGQDPARLAAALTALVPKG